MATGSGTFCQNTMTAPAVSSRVPVWRGIWVKAIRAALLCAVCTPRLLAQASLTTPSWDSLTAPANAIGNKRHEELAPPLRFPKAGRPYLDAATVTASPQTPFPFPPTDPDRKFLNAAHIEVADIKVKLFNGTVGLLVHSIECGNITLGPVTSNDPSPPVFQVAAGGIGMNCSAGWQLVHGPWNDTTQGESRAICRRRKHRGAC